MLISKTNYRNENLKFVYHTIRELTQIESRIHLYSRPTALNSPNLLKNKTRALDRALLRGLM